MQSPMILKSLSSREKSKVLSKMIVPKNNNDNECWEWDGSHNNRNVPIFWLKGHGYNAVGIVYRIYYYNRIPKDFMIRHRCNHNWCVNPDHIYIENISTGMSDVQKNSPHRRIGQRHPQAKLTRKDVIDIRKRSKTEQPLDIQKDYNVTLTEICNIINHKRWTHL